MVEEEDDDELPVDDGIEYDFDGVHDESERVHRVWAEVRAVSVPHIVPPVLYHDSGYPSNTCGDGPDDDMGNDGAEPPGGRAVFLRPPDLLSDDSDASSDEDDDDVPEFLDDNSSGEDCEVDGQVPACAQVFPTRRANLVGSSCARGVARVEGKLTPMLPEGNDHYFRELCSGEGVLSAAVRQAGVSVAPPVDRVYGPQNYLCNVGNVARVFEEMKRDRTRCVHFSPDCREPCEEVLRLHLRRL